MKAISLWQPWASLIAVGAKPFETRTWPPSRSLLGTRIAIHAAATRKGMEDVFDAFPSIDTRPFVDALAKGGYQSLDTLPFGAVICTVELTGAYRVGSHGEDRGRPVFFFASMLAGSRSINSYMPIDPFGDYTPGRWIWRLDNVQRLDPPVPAKGAQGVWNWEETRHG
jgi:hypothetical protein